MYTLSSLVGSDGDMAAAGLGASPPAGGESAGEEAKGLHAAADPLRAGCDAFVRRWERGGPFEEDAPPGVRRMRDPYGSGMTLR
jgi:hypothetical protein